MRKDQPRRDAPPASRGTRRSGDRPARVPDARRREAGVRGRESALPRGGQAQLEGRQPVLEALRAGRRIRKILMADGVRNAPVLDRIVVLASRRGVAVERVPARVLDARAHSPVAQGVIALVPPFRYRELEDAFATAEAKRQPVLLVALDGVTDPHNVGAIARSAEAAGAHALLVPERRAAEITPVVEKSAAGALAWLPVVHVGNLANELEKLRNRGVWVVSLDSSAETSLWDLTLADEPLCLVIGGEGKGVSRLVLDRSDAAVRIPLSGNVDSLNASVAGGVALFAISRVRAQAHSEALPE